MFQSAAKLEAIKWIVTFMIGFLTGMVSPLFPRGSFVLVKWCSGVRALIYICVCVRACVRACARARV